MGLHKRAGVVIALGIVLVILPESLRAQTILTNALSWFPQQTVALEYANVSSLRSLPDYASLRDHYLGKNLRTLESSLAELGIQEDDVQEMVLGWQNDGQGKVRYVGIASGQFDPESVRQRAAAGKIPAHRLGGLQAYCFPADPNLTCVTVLNSSLGVFGPLPSLEEMISARAGDGPSMASNRQLTDFVHQAESDAPIWGIAVGPAVSKWFKGWMPGEKNLQMDWAAAFKGVNALSYAIKASDNLHLSVKLDCASDEAASSVRQLLEGMKLIQQLAWQTSNPGQQNPFQSVTVAADRERVTFQLTAAYAALEQAGPLGHP
ncbi:MAG: hypothetical protein KGM47_08795 [Acidobacteriota bacterium]|nr:hypothetical protein [Acidobacteriota bacterium]